MNPVIVYIRPGCPRCEEVQAWLARLDVACQAIDVTADVSLHERDQASLPVVVLDGRELAAPFTFGELSVFVGRPWLRQPGASAAGLADPEPQPAGLAHALSTWFACHWLAFVNVLIALYLGLPFLAPVLMANGLSGPAAILYTVYRFGCHQLPQRSYFLYGPRPIYSLQELVDAVGVEQLPMYPWPSQFVGNAELGYKVALCQRDIAIYGAMLASGLAFALLRKRARPIPFWLYVLAGLVPVGLDGGSQLVSYLVPGLMPGGLPRESSWLLRSLTGALFGWATMWLALPYLQESFTSIKEQLAPPGRVT